MFNQAYPNQREPPNSRELGDHLAKKFCDFFCQKQADFLSTKQHPHVPFFPIFLSKNSSQEQAKTVAKFKLKTEWERGKIQPSASPGFSV